MRSIAAKLNFIFARLLILVLVLFMVSIGLRLVTKAILVNRHGMDNAFTRLVLWDETKVLRADQGVAAGALPDGQGPVAAPGNRSIRDDSLAGKLGDLYRQYTTLARRITNVVDTYANQQLMFRRSIVEAANQYEKLISWNLAGYSEYNNVIDLGDGYLITFMNWIDVWGNVDAVYNFREFLNTQGIPMLFVQLPNKVSRQDTDINNVVDFYNNNADRLMEWLRDFEMNTLDLRDQAEQQRVDYRSMFYNTDHHWRTETGLWAAGLISEELNRSFGFGIDSALFAPENYTFDSYKEVFLGSLGKKVTLARATPDDFTLIYPKFDVNYTLKIPSIGMDTTGGFDIIFDYSQMEIEDLYQRDLYGMYMHSSLTNHSLIQLTNNLAQEDAKKMLILGDSYTNALVPFLGLAFGHIDIVDLRHFADSLQDLIAKNGYDMVILPYSSLYQVEYNSGLSMYDFR